MAVAVGILLALVGGIAMLAGVTAARRAERLRTHGATAWAMVVPAPANSSDEDPAGQVLLQYRLPGGAVMERQATRLAPGGTVLVWYDPADPDDILVFGRDGRVVNAVFEAVGIAFILLGAAILGYAH
jgi:hypothetical protein